MRSSTDQRNAGLCGNCQFARVLVSAKGQSFIRCGRSDTDAAFERYPRLPVLTCPGHAPVPERVS